MGDQGEASKEVPTVTWREKVATITTTKIPTTTGVTVTTGAAPATKRMTTIVTTANQRTIIADRAPSYAIRYLLRKKRDPGMHVVARSVTITAKAVDRDV